jgi:hypothetical protein
MCYLIYSTGWNKNYNSLFPFYSVSTITAASQYMRELIQEGRAVKMFTKTIDVQNYRVINLKNKRVIRRK